jgi:AbiV family abortive infection protein
MDNKTFLNISKEECLIAYKKILDDSDECWESGKILALKGDYARGISLSIISIEEMVKAIIILFDGHGFEFRKTKGIAIFFKNHEIRYVVAYGLFVVGSLLGEFLDLFKQLLENPEELKRFTEEVKRDGKSFLKRMTIKFFRKFIQLRKEMEWFSKVDIMRQEGFYSDYNGYLKNPGSISEKDYLEIVNRFEIVREMGQGIVKSFKNREKKYEELKDEYKTNNYYAEIEKALDLIRKKRKKPFDLLKESFD